MHGFLIDFAQAFVKTLVLFGFPLHFGEQVVAVDADRDVAGQGRERLQIFFSKFFAAGFFSQQRDPNQAFVDDQRQQQLNLG